MVKFYVSYKNGVKYAASYALKNIQLAVCYLKEEKHFANKFAEILAVIYENTCTICCLSLTTAPSPGFLKKKKKKVWKL